MKPFDIDLARQGHPVCYRDGTVPDDMHVCPGWVDTFDPVITRIGKNQYRHHDNGRYLMKEVTDLDLFMKTENKTRWIIVCNKKPIPVIYDTEDEALDVCATFPSGTRAFTLKIELEE